MIGFVVCRTDDHVAERSASSTSLLSNVDISASLDFDAHDTGVSAALYDSSAVTDHRVVSANPTLQPDRRHSAGNHVAETRSASALASVPVTLNLEPLQPARLRPAKEKANFDSKQLESGEAVGKRQTDTAADGNGSDASTPSDSYQTPGGSPQHEAAVSIPQRLTYDMTASKSGDYVLDNHEIADSNKLQMSGTETVVLRSVLKSSDNDVGERTSFAKLRKWKERNSGSLESPVIYDQQAGPPTTMSKSVYVINPAQTTWMEAARIQRSASDRQVCRPMAEASDGGLAPSQMAGLKMKLEEKRRMIQLGKRRVEQQRSQQQQQVGDEAFVRMMRNRDRQLASQKNTAPLLGSSARSASTGRCQMGADNTGVNIALQQQQGVSKDAMIIQPSRGVTQPVLSGAMLSKAKTNTKVANSRTVTATITQPSSVMAPQRSQTDVVDSVSHDSKNQTRTLLRLQATAERTSHQLEPPQGMSFDRLSTSLSDLQAEIVRLTQQQDEIKHLVSGSANGTSTAERAPFFLNPTSSNIVSAPPSAIQTASAGAVIPPPSTQPPPHAYPPPTGYPVDPRLYVPEYGTFPPHYSSHHHHVASSLPHPGAMYPGVPPLTHRYPGGAPFMSPYPHDPMSGMYRPPGMPPTAASDMYPMQWPLGQSSQSYFMSPPYVDPSRRNVADGSMISHAAPSVPPHAVSMPGHGGREAGITGSVPSLSHPVRDIATPQPSAFFISTSSASEQVVRKPSITSPSETQSPTATASSATATPVTQATAFFVDASTVAADTLPENHSSPFSAAPVVPVSTPHATAFFVSTLPSADAVQPSDSPELVSEKLEMEPTPAGADDTAATEQRDTDADDLQPSETTEEPAATAAPAADVLPPPNVATAGADAKVPVVFVIGQDEEVCLVTSLC